MRLRRPHADLQPSGDLLVAEPDRDQLGRLPFARSERRLRRRSVTAVAEARRDSDTPQQPAGHTVRAGLLAIMDARDETHEIGHCGGVRDIANCTGLGPGDYVLFGL